MAGDQPGILNISVRVRELFHRISASVTDLELARNMNIKILNYILRCQMSDYRFYHPDVLSLSMDEATLEARLNFARLFRQCDAMDILPDPVLGIVRSTYPMNVMPISDSTRSVIHSTASRQREIVIKVVAENSANFVIYTTNFGITQDVSLPTISIVLPNLATPSAISIISRLRELCDPYNFASLLLRYSTGSVRSAGQVWHYPRVPMGASISADGPYISELSAGTLGCFCIDDNDPGNLFALTAGHVVRPVVGEDTVNVSAPASKPYAEAVTSCQIHYHDILESGKGDATFWEGITDKVVELDRLYGTTIVASTKTDDDPPHRKLDYALVQVRAARIADNRLKKIPRFDEEWRFEKNGDLITTLSHPVRFNERVCKFGIRSGLTYGTIMDDVTLRWDPAGTHQISALDPRWKSIPLSKGYAVLGKAMPDGSFEDFASPGDSGSALLRIVRNPAASVETEGAVVKTELIGIVYGIVFEPHSKAYVTMYMPVTDIFERVRLETGRYLSLNVVDRPEEEWEYEVLGKGRSMYDLH
jgi:hypothetical protein